MKRNAQTMNASLIKGLLGFLLLVASLATQAQTTLYFIHNDHLGTPQVVTDQNQQVVWEGKKKPFGETTATTATINLNTRFPGQYFDQESGYHYNYYRDYDPSLGRYLQADPIGITKDFSGPKLQVALEHGIDLKGGAHLHNPLLNHNYGYVDQNPFNEADPFGLAPKARKRPKASKEQCSYSCQDLHTALIRACQASGVFFPACKAEVDQLVVDCIVSGIKPKECSEPEEPPCENGK